MTTRPSTLSAFHHPATFRGRGVAIPVTTPLLAGSRVRNAAQSGIEVVVPNPSGAQGFYIIQLAGLTSFCAPTVHDAVLLKQLTQTGTMTPYSVRQVALRVAADGYAGHEAAAAAIQTEARDRADQLKTDFRLLVDLIEQFEPLGKRTLAPAELESRAEVVLRRLGGALGASPSRLATGLHALSEAFSPIGFPQDESDACLPRVMRRLETICAEFCDWIKEDRANDVSGLGQAMEEPLRFNRAICADILRRTQALLANPRELLRQWLANPEETIALAQRPTWVLDGWDQFCLVWMTAESNQARRPALLELPQYLPVLPKEIVDWTGIHIPSEATQQSCRVVSREDGWRTGGAAFALIERNERLRAWSL